MIEYEARNAEREARSAECEARNAEREMRSAKCEARNAKREMMEYEVENVVEIKSFDFAVRIVNLFKHLAETKKEYILSRQLLRSGTSIGANISEAERAQSQADFYAKTSIALKEANETEYWLRLLYRTDYLTEREFENIHADLKEIIALLMSITKTTRINIESKKEKKL